MVTTADRPAPSLLTIPPELRNQIWDYLFPTPDHYAPSVIYLSSTGEPALPPPTASPLLLTCKALYTETHLLYHSNTPVSLSGPHCDPDSFRTLRSSLSELQATHLRHITLRAKIQSLRALNEAWNGLPFGCPHLQLEHLTLIPMRPDASYEAYAEVADLSQCHTLAYILAETLKNLRNVRVVRVSNSNCFRDLVWRLVYRSLVYRIWKWGGTSCGLGFREDKEESWFEVLTSFNGGEDEEEGGMWRDVGHEVNRLIGAREGGERFMS